MHSTCAVISEDAVHELKEGAATNKSNHRDLSMCSTLVATVLLGTQSFAHSLERCSHKIKYEGSAQN